MPQPLAAYITTSNDGKRVQLQGLMGANILLWDMVQAKFVDVSLADWPHMYQPCFNKTAVIDGTPNQTLANNVPYYVGLYLKPNATEPTFNFIPRGFSPQTGRYTINGVNGIMTQPDLAGNVCTLLGMASSINASVLSILSGAGARILTSQSPFMNVPAQALPANTTQTGGTFNNTVEAELFPSLLRIRACQWAWRGVRSTFTGRLADNGGNMSTVFLRPFARNILTGSFHSGPVIIAQPSYAGQNIPIGGTGVSLALDDGVYDYGINGWVSHGQAHIQIEHIVEGWV